MPWAAAVLSAGLLELPFPLAGPLPPWRAGFAWIGLVPLLWAVLSDGVAAGRHPLRRTFLVAYLCGFLWYCGNCYWVYNTMLMYGSIPPFVSALLLVGFSLVLGLYFGLFGLGVVLVRRATGSARLALLFAPFLWVALDLAAARITSVPWDQLGYALIDNQEFTKLAPWTGVYGITFVIVALNALIAEEALFGRRPEYAWVNRPFWRVLLAVTVFAFTAFSYALPENPAPTNEAVLVQPNLDVGKDATWGGLAWDQNIAQFAHLGGEDCKSYIAGIPQTGAPNGEIVCPPYATHPDLVVWPESPAPFVQGDPRLQQALSSVALQTHAPLIVGGIGADYDPHAQAWNMYNSAMVVNAQGQMVGRYDKIHLVPFGEYIPFQNLLRFAHKLTGRVGQFSRGTTRQTFLLDGHRYGVFICYESVFADEVRHFAANGAEVLVNISDDGWYGDTSAPWQHLNMVRMRAVENRRWLLRDTNTGVTAVIDPYGRVRESIPRHQVDALPAQFAFSSDVTFYSAHGDVFAWVCAILSIGVIGWSIQKSQQHAS